MHYYQHNLGDYAKDTGHISLLEHGAYRLLLDHYYATEKPLPAKKDALERICRATNRAEKLAVSSIAQQFFREENGTLVHSRVEREIEAFRGKQDTASKAGKASGEARRASKEASEKTNGRSTDVQQTFNGRSTDVAIPLPVPLNQPLTINQEPLTSILLEKESKGEIEIALANFETFWSNYPHPPNDAKKPAMKAFLKLKKKDQAAALADDTRRRYVDKDTQFIPHASTFLNQARFADVVHASKQATPVTQGFLVDRAEDGSAQWTDFSDKPTDKPTSC